VVKIFGSVATQPTSVPPRIYEATYIVSKDDTLAELMLKVRDNVQEDEPEEVQVAVTGCISPVFTSICAYRAKKNGMTAAGFALGNEEVKISWTSDPAVLCIFPIATTPWWMDLITFVATSIEADGED
jgi:hypothetical protein